MARGKDFWYRQLGEGWAEALKPILKTEYADQLINGLDFEYVFMEMYPKEKKDIFKAFRVCPWDSLRAVVIGTEPGPMSGLGPLAFSDNSFISPNPSAYLIRQCVSEHKKELYLDFDTTFEYWGSQGILMLNRSLTCRAGEPKSSKEDWKQFFGTVLYAITYYKPGTIFLLWGKEAQKYSSLLSTDHHVFSWEHPMKASNEFRKWECPNFAQVDKLLSAYEKNPIIW
jgi:uracil-DNA glycosylase